MDIQRARQIVYGFADILGQGAPLIPDASSLPWDKATLKQAYSVFLAAMEAEKRENPTSFIRNGYEDTLNQAQVCMIHIDDYHHIAPEDATAIARLNTRPDQDSFDDETIKLLMKYPIGGAK